MAASEPKIIGASQKANTSERTIQICDAVITESIRFASSGKKIQETKRLTFSCTSRDVSVLSCHNNQSKSPGLMKGKPQRVMSRESWLAF